MLSTLATFRVSVAGAAVGVAQAALEEALGAHDHRASSSACRSPASAGYRPRSRPAGSRSRWRGRSTYRAAAAAARDPLGALHLSSMAKVGATEMASRVVDRSVQVDGPVRPGPRQQDRAALPRGPADADLRGLHRGDPRLAGQEARQGPPAHDHRLPHARLAGPHRRGHAGATSGRDAAAVRRHALRACSRTMDEAGIDKGLALGVGIKASTVARTNEFIGSVPRDRLVPMGTVHPELPVDENLTLAEGQRDRRGQAAPAVPEPLAGRPAGARHPRRARRGGHAGHQPRRRRRGRGGQRARRRRAAAAARRRAARPDADRLPLRRLPPPGRGGGARRRLAGDPRDVVAADHGRASTRSGVVAIIRRHGADRVVYGSDWPMADPAAEIAAIRALGAHARGDRRHPRRQPGPAARAPDRMSGKVVRLGAGMAFWGDRVQPAIEMVERGDIDYLCCDHLAELTMSILAKQRAKNPERGYTRDVIDLLRGALPACVEKGVKVVTNAGGANPRAAARADPRAGRRARPPRRPDRRRPRRRHRGPDRRPRSTRASPSPTSTPAPSSTRSATGSPTPRSTPAARASSRRSTWAPTSSSAAG